MSWHAYCVLRDPMHHHTERPRMANRWPVDWSALRLNPSAKLQVRIEHTNPFSQRVKPGRPMPEESGTSFADLLRQLRSAAALSQEALAERAGLSVRGISDLERGLIQAPRLETVRMLADGLALADDERTALLAAARPAVWAEAPVKRRRPPLVSLPVPLTRLIGREAELEALRTALQDEEVRWVTLTGPGGVGKTRLAVAVVSGLHETFSDGIVFIDLAPVTDPALVVPTVAAAPGVRESAEQSLIATLSSFLAPSRRLLV